MRNGKTILFLIVCSLLFSITYAQNAWLDSLKKAAIVQQADTNKVWTLTTIASYYTFNDPDSAIIYSKRALALAEKFHYDRGMFWSIQTLHGALFVTGNYTEELDYALKALPIAKRLNDLYAYGWSNGMIADSYISLGDYVSATPYIRIVMKNIAENYPNEMFSGDAVMVAFYIGIHQYDSALYSARKSLALLKAQPALYNGNTNDGNYAKSQVYLYLGQAFEVNNLYDSALYYYRQSIPFSTETEIKIFVLDAYNGIAHIFKEQHQTDSAIWYAKKVLGDKLTKAYPSAKLKAASLLADIYEKEKKTDSSLKYLRVAGNLKDSIYSREKTSAFQNALLKEQEKQKEIQAATTAVRQRYTLYFIVALFILLMIVTGIILHNRRMKQLYAIRNSIADDLHDDIGSTLSSISIMNELAKAKSPEALPLLTSIGENTAAIQENMSDIVWTINPNNDQFGNLLQRMNLFATEITEAKKIELQFSSDVSLSTARLTMKQRKNLYLFFKEAINNAVKHSGAGKINVIISKKEQDIEMTILDNGGGFNTSEIFSGNGMSSLKKRAEELNAKYDITSVQGEGTTAHLEFRMA